MRRAQTQLLLRRRLHHIPLPVVVEVRAADVAVGGREFDARQGAPGPDPGDPVVLLGEQEEQGGGAADAGHELLVLYPEGPPEPRDETTQAVVDEGLAVRTRGESVALLDRQRYAGTDPG